LDLCKAPLWVRRSPVGRRLAALHGIRAGARINVDYAGPWARRNWRFTLSEDRFVSAWPRWIRLLKLWRYCTFQIIWRGLGPLA